MLSFGSCRVVSPSNRSLYITSVGWVYSLTIGAVLIYLSLSTYIHIESMLPTFSHHSPLFSCSKEVETSVDHSSVILTLHVGHSWY